MDSCIWLFKNWCLLLESRFESVFSTSSQHRMPLDQRLRSDLSPIPGMWQKVFLNKAFLLASRDSGFASRIFVIVRLRTYHNSRHECKNFVGCFSFCLR